MSAPRSLAVPILSVRTEDGRTFRFSRPFNVGRQQDCDVQIEDAHVSRKHVIVSFGNGRWRIRDQQSGNGVLVDGQRVETATIDSSLTIQLGADGPLLVMGLEGHVQPAKAPPAAAPAGGETIIVASYAERYFGTPDDDEAVGGRTLMIRKAFHSVQRKQRRLYFGIAGVAALAAIVAGGYAYYGQRQMARQQAVAEELFYAMKSLDVDVANVERRLMASGSTQGQDQVNAYLERRRQMDANYDRFIAGLKLYDRALTPQEQLILRVTRLFGECEMAAPPEYLAEVVELHPEVAGLRTIRHGSGSRAGEGLHDEGSPKSSSGRICRRSSSTWRCRKASFDEIASGPPTRMGIAKGMWQFIPETASRYGLTIGPLAGVRRPDPADDRHNWEKATRAAARVHQGDLLHRRPGIRPAGHGVVQLGRTSHHQHAAHHAGQSQGA